MVLWFNKEPADSYYEVRPECTDVPETKFKIRPGKTLSVRKWQAAFAPDGQLDIGKTLGIRPTIRGEVWEFLLGCFDPQSTYEEREQLLQERRYEKWKSVCHEIFPVVGSGQFITAPVITEDGQPIQEPLVDQEADNAGNTDMVNDLLSKGPLNERIINWLLQLHQICLDVKRTDRTLVFYEKQENLAELWDILVVYAWIDRDGKKRGNLRCTESSVGVESQLSHLAMVTQVIDPKLHQHLETLGGGDYLFAVRMLMVLFRREFSFFDSLYLWQMMWALEYDPDLFYLYEEPSSSMNESKMRSRSMCDYMKIKSDEAPLPISVFLVASVLKEKSTQLLHEA
ncbi:early nodulin-like protein 3-like [Hibiscus syriacus]|uniref:Early nodulin-like protein 3-like n=1 Tax=Hibiscus syriacus TaxID=106335 RepID=A0A6A2YXU8_HIBSY|nr:early nodulin-like protein 3-like [Hibiscus syriacus]